jgi:hypothetical protein
VDVGLELHELIRRALFLHQRITGTPCCCVATEKDWVPRPKHALLIASITPTASVHVTQRFSSYFISGFRSYDSVIAAHILDAIGLRRGYKYLPSSHAISLDAVTSLFTPTSIMFARTLAVLATVSAVLASGIPKRAISQCSGTPGGVYFNGTSLTDTPTKVVSLPQSTGPVLTGAFYYNGHGGAPCAPQV